MKRSCRRTADENRIHERAVRLRKMTDKQLVEYVETCHTAPTVIRPETPKDPVDIEGIIEDIGKIRGVGITKLHYIREILKARLEVCDG
ncbi:MAG: hypothetical protein K6G83_15885 [Lachnospiraceae bacterium]|nr:hypothetical protein [Lachnospiraceae bacterium]